MVAHRCHHVVNGDHQLFSEQGLSPDFGVNLVVQNRGVSLNVIATLSLMGVFLVVVLSDLVITPLLLIGNLVSDTVGIQQVLSLEL